MSPYELRWPTASKGSQNRRSVAVLAFYVIRRDASAAAGQQPSQLLNSIASHDHRHANE